MNSMRSINPEVHCTNLSKFEAQPQLTVNSKTPKLQWNLLVNNSIGTEHFAFVACEICKCHIVSLWKVNKCTLLSQTISLIFRQSEVNGHLIMFGYFVSWLRHAILTNSFYTFYIYKETLVDIVICMKFKHFESGFFALPFWMAYSAGRFSL